MWSFATSLLQKVVHFSPVKTIFQQLFQKFSKDFLQSQPLFNFKDGILELDNLKLSSTKINQTFLIGSPYVLHHGMVKSIRIRLPASNEQNNNKNIEIKVDGIELIMEPNQHFREIFEENIKNIKKDEVVVVEAKNQPTSTSFSFFKRMLQEFFTNMKIDILNITIKWFMNKPSKQNSTKPPQYFIMLRIPKIATERVNDKEVGKIHEDFMKYKTEIPQISMHILKENFSVNQYFNIRETKDDIPNRYPPVTHPSTIFLIGKQDEKSKERVLITLRISKNIKEKTKQLSINVEDIPNMEVMVSPVQMIVLKKYIEQIHSFKRVYNAVIEKVKAQSVPFNRLIDQSRDFDVLHNQRSESDLERRESRLSPFKNLDTNRSMDLFSSFAVSIENIGYKTASKPPSYFEAIFQNNKEMEEEIGKIEKQILRESMEKQQNISNQKTQQFKSLTIFKLNLHLLRVYILKQETGTQMFEYQRIWSIDQFNVKSAINNFVPSPYFMISLNDLIVSFETSHTTTVKFKELSVIDVQIKSRIKQEIKKQISILRTARINETTQNLGQSIDVFQSCKGIPLQQVGNFKQLLRYQINPQYSHYCSTTIFTLSNKYLSLKACHNPIYTHTNQSILLKTNSNSNDALKDKQFGFVLTYQKQDKPKINCSVFCLSLVINDDFLHDLLMILKPLITYKQLMNSKTDLSSCEAQGQIIKSSKILSHSIYDFHDQVGGQHHYGDSLVSMRIRSNTGQSQNGNKKSNKPEINFEIEQLHVVLPVFTNVQRSIVKDYITICQNDGNSNSLFDRQCHCQKKIQGIDLIAQYINIKRCPNNNIKLNFSDLSARLVKSHSKQKLQIEDLLHISKQGRSYPKLTIETITTETIVKKQVITIRIPKFGIVLHENTPKQILPYLEKWKQKIDSFIQLNRYLTEQISRFSSKSTPTIKVNPKISKATQIINVYFERLGLQFLSYQLLIKHVLIKFEDKLFTCKIFEGVLAKTNQPSLKLQNHWTSSEFAYYKNANKSSEKQDSFEYNFKKYGLRSGIDRIVAFIDKTMDFPLQGQLKEKEYFETLFRLPVPIEINLVFQSHKYKPNNNNSNQQKSFRAPNFSKASKNQPTLNSKILDIIVRVPIFVKGIQLKDFKSIKFYFDQTKNMFKNSEILNPRNKPRRPSEDNIIPPETFQQKIIVKVFAQVLHVDIFPYVNFTPQQETVSHTRSIIEIQDLQISFNQKQTIDCSAKVERLKIKWRSISIFFLVFFDCHIELNKEVILFKQMESYGFQRLLDIKGEFEMVETKTREKGKQVELNANIFQIESTFSSKTIGYLQDHVKHILMNIKQAMKHLNNNNQPQQQPEQSDSEQSAENFDQIDSILEAIEANKLRQQSQFRSDPIRLVQRQNKQSLILRLNIKQLDIKRLTIKITDTPDYQFITYIPRGEDAPLVIELNERMEVSSDMFIEKHQINRYKRFRGKQYEEGKVLKVVLENVVLYLQKYEDSVNPREPNLSLVVNLKALDCGLYVPNEQQTIGILKTIDRFQILVDVQNNKTKVKTSGRHLQLGFSSALNYLKNDINTTNQKRRQSIFSQPQQSQQPVNAPSSSPTSLLLYIPQMSVTLNLKLIGWKFISNQHLNVPPLFFHNTLSKYMAEDNKEFVKQWIKSILTDNLGKLLGNGFTNLVSNSLIGLLMCVKQIVMLPGHAIGMLKIGS